VPEELASLVGEYEGYWRLRSRQLPVLLDWLETAGVILLLAVLVAGLVSRVRWFRRWRFADCVPLLGRLFRRRLRVESFDVAAITGLSGPGLAALVEGRLQELDAEGSGSMLEVVRGQDTAVAIPTNLPGSPPQAQALAVVVEWLLPRNVIAVSGYLHGLDGEHRPGMTVSLMDRDGVISQMCTIRGEPLDQNAAQNETIDPARYLDLTRRAAAWTHHQLIQALDLPSLGTTDWRSYDAFLDGVQAERELAYEEAQSSYGKAIQLDRFNLLARFNSASLEMRATGKDTPSTMRRIVDDIERSSDSQGDARRELTYQQETLWYRAQYATVASCLHEHERAVATGEALDSSTDLSSAIEGSYRLLQALEATVAKAGRTSTGWRLLELTAKSAYYRRRHATNLRLYDFLRELEPCAFVVLASSLVHTMEQSQCQAIEVRPSKATFGWTRILPGPIFWANLRRRVLGDENAAQPDPKTVNALIAYVYSLEVLPPRARYNLACFYSTLGKMKSRFDPNSAGSEEAYNESIAALRLAFRDMELEERAFLLVWAQKDPSLVPVRIERNRDFSAIINRHGEDIGVEVLEDLQVLDAGHSRALLRRGVLTLQDLVDARGRVEFWSSLSASGSELYSGELDQAFDMAELIIKLQLDISIAKLLHGVYVRSIKLLEIKNEDSLHEELERLVNGKGPIPEKQMLRDLIERARAQASAAP
jgi:hypothetical protein